ncbi:hypothetical protein D1831_13205 [Lactiplantibacillus garii]|uniref:Uncharacterized protein n=1 Tax=Lactiplantibacillus garii TaxID=2306423 RepID=A0A3R8KJK0_9LACO|nr:hypothetical protein [Lactiplantibacillus garii]RRK09358.1 hypothetical protein D1831_13205 [Lactiplantibacillus garii]
MNNTQIQLNHAKATLQGTLVQLDYLQELVNGTAMNERKWLKISQQIHNIKLNSIGAADELASVQIIPLIGETV